MGLREVRLALVVALLAAPRFARADADVTVTREDGLDQCPDAVELRHLAASFVAQTAPAPTHLYHVIFTRQESKLRSEVTDETAPRVRRLEDSGSDCAPLGQAVAVVLATMWSSEKQSPEPAPPIVRLVPPPAPAPSAHWTHSAHWTQSEGPALAIGIVRPVAAALRADVGLELSPLAFGAGVLWLPEQELDLSPGVVDVQLISGDVRVCARVSFGTRLGLCASAYGGAIFAGGSGYTTNANKSRPWFAFGPEAFVDGPILRRLLRYRLAAAAPRPVPNQTFSGAGG